MKRWWIAVGLAVGGLLLAWLMAPVATIATVRIQFTGRPPLPANALEIEAKILRSGMIRHRVISSLSETEKKLLHRDVNSVPLPIVQFNSNEATFAVAIIDSRAEVAALLADRYVSEFFRHSNGTYGVDPEEAKQMLRAAQARLIQEIKAAQTAVEANRQSHAEEAAAELEKTIVVKENAVRETAARLASLDVVRSFEIFPYRRLGSETATLDRFQLFIRGLSDAAANSRLTRP